MLYNYFGDNMNKLDFYMIKILEDKIKYLFLYKKELENNNFLGFQKKKIREIDKKIKECDHLLLNEYLKLEQIKK